MISPITFRQLIEFSTAQKKPQQVSEDSPQDYSLRSINEIKTAIINIRYFDDGKKFGVFLEKIFDSINKTGIQSLIIDLRNNGGGDSSLGDQLFKYVANRPFTQYGTTAVEYSKLQKAYYKNKCSIDSMYCETYRFLSEQRDGVIEILKNEDLIIPYETPRHYKGKIYLLTGLRTFSSAANFAQCFKHYNLGTIVGEETGGWIVSYGDKIMTELPITRMPL